MNKDNIVIKIKETSRFKIFKNLLDKKEYDTIYSLFGKHIYSLFVPIEYKKEDIKRLLNEGNIGEINKKYGKFDTIFIKNFRRTKKNRIKSLIKDGKFLELYDTFGDKVFKKNEGKIYEQDVLYETGSKLKAKAFRLKKYIAKDIKYSLIYLVLEPVVLFVLSNNDTYLYYKGKYDKMVAISEYNNSVLRYTNNIKALNIDNDIDLIVKLLNDSKAGNPFNNENLYLYNLSAFSYSTYDTTILIDRNYDLAFRLNLIDSRYEADEITANKYKKENNNDNNYEETDYQFTTFKPIEKDYTMVLDNEHCSVGFIYDNIVFLLPNMDITDPDYSNNIQYFTITGVEYLEDSNKSTYNNPSKEELKEIFKNWNEGIQKLTVNRLNIKGVN